MSIFKKYVSYLKQKRRFPQVYVRGLSVYHVEGRLGGSAKKVSWVDSIVDAFIISGLTFFSTLGGDAVSGLSSVLALKAAAVAACIQFFIFLSIKRGIRQTMSSK